MSRKLLPFNLSIRQMSPEQKRIMTPVTTLDIFDATGGQFSDEGLFSTTIFGRPGDERRSTTFSYVELRIPVPHPVIFDNLVRLKGLYGDIMAGTRYAVFNTDTKDFEPSSALEGDTGMAFFFSHWGEFTLQRTDSPSRNIRIDVIERYKDVALFTSWPVLPAGLRELDVDQEGRTRMDEINEPYQRLIALSRGIPERVAKDDLPIYDNQRYQLTTVLRQVYDYIENIISGKKGFIQKRFASRRIFNSTRGVITSRDVTAVDLDQHNRPGYMDTVVGIWQLSRAVLPKTKYYLKTGLLGEIFESASTGHIRLVNKDTLKAEDVEINSTVIDAWFTSDGFEAMVSSMEVIEGRHLPIEINDHYLALVYTDDQYFRVMRTIDELPEGYDAGKVHPMTLIELIYIAGYTKWNIFPALITRYPITGMESTVPTGVYVNTTSPAQTLKELDEDWEEKGEEYVAYEFPLLQDPARNTKYFDTIAPPVTALEGQGADFDGDTESFTVLYTEEGINEVHRYMKQRVSHIRPEGGLAYSNNVHTVALAMRNMTGPVKKPSA